MKILVQGHPIETKDIVRVHDIEHGKRYFLNREAGFVIWLQDGQDLRFYEKIPYETYPRRIQEIKNIWEDRMNAVIALWEKDKIDYPTVQW